MSISVTTYTSGQAGFNSSFAYGCGRIKVINGGTSSNRITLQDISSNSNMPEWTHDSNINHTTKTNTTSTCYIIGGFDTGSANTFFYGGNEMVQLYSNTGSDNGTLDLGNGTDKLVFGNRVDATFGAGVFLIMAENYNRDFFHLVPFALPNARIRCINGARVGFCGVETFRYLITNGNSANTTLRYVVDNGTLLGYGNNLNNGSIDVANPVDLLIYGGTANFRQPTNNPDLALTLNTNGDLVLFCSGLVSSTKVLTIRDFTSQNGITSQQPLNFRFIEGGATTDVTWNMVRHNHNWNDSYVNDDDETVQIYRFISNQVSSTINLRQDITITPLSETGGSLTGTIRLEHSEFTTTFSSTNNGNPTQSLSATNTTVTRTSVTTSTFDTTIVRYAVNKSGTSGTRTTASATSPAIRTIITTLRYNWRLWGRELVTNQDITIAQQPTTTITFTSNTDENLTATSSANVDHTADTLDDVYDSFYANSFANYTELPFTITNGIMIFNSTYTTARFRTSGVTMSGVSGTSVNILSNSTIGNGTIIRGMILPSATSNTDPFTVDSGITANVSRAWNDVVVSGATVARHMKVTITTGTGAVRYVGTYTHRNAEGQNVNQAIAYTTVSNGTIDIILQRARINGTVTLAVYKVGMVDRVLHYDLGEFGVVETETFVAKQGTALLSPYPNWDSVLTLTSNNSGVQNVFTLTYNGASGSNDLPATSEALETDYVEIAPSDAPTLVDWINRQEAYLDSTLELYSQTNGSLSEGQITINDNDDIVITNSRLVLVIANTVDVAVRVLCAVLEGTSGTISPRAKNAMHGQKWDLVYGANGSRVFNPANVWEFRSRTLTNPLTATQVWTHSSRTLTSGSNSDISTINTNVQTLVSELTGASNAPTITFTRGVASNGTTYGFAITGNVVQYGAIGDNSTGDRTISPFTVPIDTLTFVNNANSTLDIVIDFNGNDAARSQLDKEAIFRVAQGTNSLEFELNENHFDEGNSTFAISLTWSSTNHNWLLATGTGTLQVYFSMHDMVTANFEDMQEAISDINTIDTRTNTINTTLNSVDDKIDDISSSVHFPTLSSTLTLDAQSQLSPAVNHKTYSSSSGSIGSQTIDGFFNANITQIDTRIPDGATQLRLQIDFASAITGDERLNNTIRITSGSNSQDFTYTTTNWNAGRTELTVNVNSASNNTFLSDSSTEDVVGTILIPDRQIRDILFEMEEDTDLIPGLNTRVTDARMTSIDNLNTRVTDTRMTNLDTMYNELVGIENAPTISYIRGYQSGTPNTYGFAITGTNVQYGGLGDNTEEQRTISPFSSAIETLSFQEINNSTIRATIEFDDYTKAVSQLDKDAIFRITQGTNVLEFELNEGHAILANSLFRVDIPNNSTTEWIVTGTSNLTCNLQVYFSMHDMVTANFEDMQELVDDVNSIDTRTTTMNTNINTINTNVTTIDTVVDEILDNTQYETFTTSFTFIAGAPFGATLENPHRVFYDVGTMNTSLGSTNIQGFYSGTIHSIDLFKVTTTTLRLRISILPAVTSNYELNDTITLTSDTYETSFTYTSDNWNTQRTRVTVDATINASDYPTVPLWNSPTGAATTSGNFTIEHRDLRTMLQSIENDTDAINTNVDTILTNTSELVEQNQWEATVTIRKSVGFTDATFVGFYVDSSNNTQGGMNPTEIDLFDDTSYEGVEFTEFYTVTNNSQMTLYFNLSEHIPLNIIHTMDLKVTLSGTEHTVNLSATTNISLLPLEYRVVISSAVYSGIRAIANNGTLPIEILVGAGFHALVGKSTSSGTTDSSGYFG